MPVEVLWDERSCPAIRFDMEGSWQWSELLDAFEEAHRMREQRDVHYVIVNHLPGAKPPVGSFWEARRLVERMRLDVIIINAGGNAFIAELVQIVSFLYPKFGARIKMVKTLEMAYSLCAKIEPSFASSRH